MNNCICTRIRELLAAAKIGGVRARIAELELTGVRVVDPACSGNHVPIAQQMYNVIKFSCFPPEDLLELEFDQATFDRMMLFLCRREVQKDGTLAACSCSDKDMHERMRAHMRGLAHARAHPMQ